MNSLEPNERPQEKLPPFVRRLLFTDCLLRVVMGVIAITLPFVLVGGGWYNDIKIQHSLSHYYFASPTIFPMRRGGRVAGRGGRAAAGDARGLVRPRHTVALRAPKLMLERAGEQCA
jgi:hypothetical protein